MTKLFILWCILHGFNAFFGSLLVGSIFGKGIGHAIIWSYTSDTEKVLYSIISITALVLLGVFVTRSFLLTANSYYSKLEPPHFRRFIWAQVILPFFAGNAIIAAIMSPGLVVHDYTIALSLIITIIPIAFGYRFYPALYFDEENVRISINIRPVMYSLIFIIAYRLILGTGIPFG